MYIDSHAHLNLPGLVEKIEETVAQANSEGVGKIVCIGTGIEDSSLAIKIANNNNCVYASVGIHPNEDSDINSEAVNWRGFEEFLKNKKVVAVGECGLDFSRIKNVQEIERQKRLFDKQIFLAQKNNLPLVIHIREAYQEIMDGYENLKELSGVFHCFSGDGTYLEIILNRLTNFFISFAGNITIKNAGNIRRIEEIAPQERILIETDTPFLSQETLRGITNSPANVKIVASEIARIKDIPLNRVEEQTTANSIKLFRL